MADGPELDPGLSSNQHEVDIAFAETFVADMQARGFVVEVGYIEACDLYPKPNAYAVIWSRSEYDEKLKEYNEWLRSVHEISLGGRFVPAQELPWDIFVDDPNFAEGDTREQALRTSLRKGYENFRAKARKSPKQ